jgi:hypothetical protein
VARIVCQIGQKDKPGLAYAREAGALGASSFCQAVTERQPCPNLGEQIAHACSFVAQPPWLQAFHPSRHLPGVALNIGLVLGQKWAIWLRRKSKDDSIMHPGTSFLSSREINSGSFDKIERRENSALSLFVRPESITFALFGDQWYPLIKS